MKQQLIMELNNVKEPLLVATSAGSDSMALLDMLFKNDYNIIACYVNHKQRPKEIEEEISCLKGYCNERNIPFFSLEIDLERHKNNKNKQAFFREERYRLLKKKAKELGIKILVTGHHQDDQAETMLMRLVKNYEIVSLSGIQYEVNDKDEISIIRPLLKFRKQALIDYCKIHAVPYLNDSSNLSDEYLRNSLRRNVIHQFEKENRAFIPEFVEKMTDFVQYYDYLFEDFRKQIQLWNIEYDSILFSDVYEFLQNKNQSIQKLIIEIMLKVIFQYEKRLKQEKILEILFLIIAKETRVKIPLSENDYFCIQYGRIFLLIDTSGNEEDIQKLTLGENVYQDYKILCLENLEENEDYDMMISQESFNKGIYLRNAKKTDYLLMKNGRKKFNRLYIDQKVIPSIRFKTPVLVSADDIVFYDFVTGKYSYNIIENNTNELKMSNIYLKFFKG